MCWLGTQLKEFKGTGNLELHLDRKIAEKRIYPAINVRRSGTRREEMLMGPDEVKVTWKLRRALAGLDQQQALEVGRHRAGLGRHRLGTLADPGR